jgi:hypothetical protein
MEKKILILLLSGITAISCTDGLFQPTSSVADNDNNDLKMAYGKSLSRALVADKDLRFFLKEQALKMINGDYDVPYSLVKHEKLGSGITFEEALSKQFESPEDLKKIEALCLC